MKAILSILFYSRHNSPVYFFDCRKNFIVPDESADATPSTPAVCARGAQVGGGATWCANRAGHAEPPQSMSPQTVTPHAVRAGACARPQVGGYLGHLCRAAGPSVRSPGYGRECGCAGRSRSIPCCAGARARGCSAMWQVCGRQTVDASAGAQRAVAVYRAAQGREAAVRCGRCAGARLWTRVRVHSAQSQCTVLRRGARRQCDVVGVRVPDYGRECRCTGRSRSVPCCAGARGCSAMWQVCGHQTVDASAGAQRAVAVYRAAQVAGARLQCTVAGVRAPDCGRECGCAGRGPRYVERRWSYARFSPHLLSPHRVSRGAFGLRGYGRPARPARLWATCTVTGALHGYGRSARL
jgi:hypothetical protein